LEYKDIYQAISLAKYGDKDAREYVVTYNTGLVWSIVKKFMGRGYDPDDLFQIGSIGLIKAMDKFDKDFNVKFSTYAVPLIMGEIKRHIRDDGIIKVSRNIKEIAIKARSATDKLSKKLGKELSVKEIAEYIGVPAEEIAIALDATVVPESINASIGDDGKELGETIACKGDMEQAIISRIAIKDALCRLAYRERQVIILRYFNDKTQLQIAKLLGISQVQVSRIEKRVLQKMKKMIVGL